MCEYPVDVTDDLRLAECMMRITPEMVVERIEQMIGSFAKLNSLDLLPERPQIAASPTFIMRQRRLRIDFPHDAVAAAMFTAVLKGIRQRFSDWHVEVQTTSVAAAEILAGLTPTTVQPSTRTVLGGWDRIQPVTWELNRSSYAEYPSTPTTKCLLEELSIRPNLLEMEYEVQPAASCLHEVDEVLRSLNVHRQQDTGRHRLLLLEASIRRKSLVLETSAREAGLMLGRLEVVDSASGDWLLKFSGDCRRIDLKQLIAWVARSGGLVSTPTLPLYLAAATKTPALGLWKKGHPVHEFDLSDYVIHLVPPRHARQICGRAAAEFFSRQYRHRIVELRLAPLSDDETAAMGVNVAGQEAAGR